MTYRRLAGAAVAAMLVMGSLPTKAQIYSGSLTPVPSNELAQRIAAARAEFGSVLANALAPDSVQAMLRLIKDQPDLAGGGITNFDNINAPCDFAQTGAFFGREQFAGFFGPLPDGGGILNECSNFGVNAHSPPNFLAFNNTSTFLSGGIPKTPELIVVGPNKSRVSLWVSGGAKSGFPIALIALGNDAVQEVITTTTAPGWVQISLAATAIQGVVLVGDPLQVVIDDIEAQ